MLYQFDVAKQELDPLVPVTAASADVLEKDIETAVARRPEVIFRTRTRELPILLIRTSAPAQAMADIIGLDSEGRLVLVECKRHRAARGALVQLLDYASRYHGDAWARLEENWARGEGRASTQSLLQAFREFTDGAEPNPADVGTEEVLVVVAAGGDDDFQRISRYLHDKGVTVALVTIELFRRGDELFIDVSDPVDLDASSTEPGQPYEQAPKIWMINTDEKHAKGATSKVLERNVAAIWGYPDGGKTLERGVKPGDLMFAYQNGVGLVAGGTVVDGEVYQAKPEDSVFPNTPGDNEYHMKVAWKVFPHPISNREVSQATGNSLPVRGTFSGVRKPKVRALLREKYGSMAR